MSLAEREADAVSAAVVADKPVIEMDNVDKDFLLGGAFFNQLSLKALSGVSLRLTRGRALALVGESGSGKSTCARMLARAYEPTNGAIRFHGEDIGQFKGERLQRYRSEVQMVFQDPFGSIHPRHTIGRTLLEPLEIHGLGQRQERIGQILQDVGLPHNFRYRFPHQLSGGQRQRVAIARALILKPQILLLDEPTSALDVSVQAEILNLLKDLRDRENLTFVLVSHDMAVIAHLCDRVAVMQDGIFVEVTTKQNLLQGTIAHPYTKTLLDGSKGYVSPRRTKSLADPLAVS